MSNVDQATQRGQATSGKFQFSEKSKDELNEFEKEALAQRASGKTLPPGVQAEFEKADNEANFKWFSNSWRQHSKAMGVHALGTFGTFQWDKGFVPWLIRSKDNRLMIGAKAILEKFPRHPAYPGSPAEKLIEADKLKEAALADVKAKEDKQKEADAAGAAAASEEDAWKQRAREMKLDGKTCAEIAEALTALKLQEEEFTKKKVDAFFKKEKEKAAKAAAKAAKA